MPHLRTSSTTAATAITAATQPRVAISDDGGSGDTASTIPFDLSPISDHLPSDIHYKHTNGQGPLHATDLSSSCNNSNNMNGNEKSLINNTPPLLSLLSNAASVSPSSDRRSKEPDFSQHAPTFASTQSSLTGNNALLSPDAQAMEGN
jgi:hypothetical protein